MSMQNQTADKDAQLTKEDRIDDLEDGLDHLSDELIDIQLEYEAELEQQSATIETQQQTINRLKERVDELDERTDMLRVIEKADQSDYEQRTATLLMHLRRNVESEVDRGRDPIASLTKEDARHALHDPDIDRTTYYSDFERAVRWVGDTEICRKAEKNGNTRLILDLQGVDDDRIKQAIRHGGD